MTALVNIAFMLAVLVAGMSIPLLILKSFRRYPKSTVTIFLLAIVGGVIFAEKLFPRCRWGWRYARCNPPGQISAAPGPHPSPPRP